MYNTDVKISAVIKFFRSHDRILAMLHQEMELTGQKRLVLLRPVLTRWTSYFQACRRLVEVEKAMRALIIRRRDDILSTVKKSQEQEKVNSAKYILKVIEDEAFWARLHLTHRVLEPLAVAALVLQADGTRLDHILLSLGKLYTGYRSIYNGSTDEEERYCCSLLITSLESRWGVADQDLYITAVILNPFVGQQRLCFNYAVPEWQHNGLYIMLNRVYKRVFKEEAPGSLLEEWTDYRRRQGVFTADKLQLQHFVDKARHFKQSPDPAAVWTCMDDDESPLIRLALRIFLYTPNSAALERLFSHQSEIEGVKRTHLHTNRVADLAIVASDIGSTHRENRKRKYGSRDYAGDLFLSQKIQCVIDDEVDDGTPLLLDSSTVQEATRTRRWYQGILDENDNFDILDNTPDTTTPPGLIPLSTLFDAGSSPEVGVSVSGYLGQPWAMGNTIMDAETAYYTALMDPLSTAVVPDFPTEE